MLAPDLCTPVVDKPEFEPLRVLESQVVFIEEQIDKFNAELKPLKSFVLPSGTPAAALLHVARTVTRRAERTTWHCDSLIWWWRKSTNCKVFKSFIRFII
jgi:cob(I)alamin adenosyltransferase